MISFYFLTILPFMNGISHGFSLPVGHRTYNMERSADLQREPSVKHRLVRAGKGQYCDYGSNRSQYCYEGCCGDQYSSLNQVCCKESSNSTDNTGTIVGASVGGFFGVMLLIVVVCLFWNDQLKCRTSSLRLSRNSITERCHCHRRENRSRPNVNDTD